MFDNRDPIEILDTTTLSVVDLVYNPYYFSIRWPNTYLKEESFILRENEVYRIFDDSSNDLKISEPDLLAKINNCRNLCDINIRGKEEDTENLTSILVLKVRSCQYPIPVSRWAYLFGYKDADGNAKISLHFSIYPEKINFETIFRPEFDDIEYLDMIVLSSVKAFKRHIKDKNRTIEAIVNKSTINKFDKNLV
jgi:hypothetical protein